MLLGFKTTRSVLTIFILLAMSVGWVLQSQSLAQDNAEEPAKRIQQLEKENAQLRAEIEKLQREASFRLDGRQVPARPERAPFTNVPPMSAEQAQLLQEINRLHNPVPKPLRMERTNLPPMTAEQAQL